MAMEFSSMDFTSLKDLMSDRSRRANFSSEQNRDLVYATYSKCPEGTALLLCLWKSREIWQVVCAELGREANFNGKLKAKWIKQLVELLQERRSNEFPEANEPEETDNDNNVVNMAHGHGLGSGLAQNHPALELRLAIAPNAAHRDSNNNNDRSNPCMLFGIDIRKPETNGDLQLRVGDSSRIGRIRQVPSEFLNAVNKDFDHYIKVVRWLECEGLLEPSFRVKFFTWYSLRATPQAKQAAKAIIDAMIDDPNALCEQLVDTFSNVIF